MSKSKTVSAETAPEKIRNGQTIMISGFSNAGSPDKFVRAITDAELIIPDVVGSMI